MPVHWLCKDCRKEHGDNRDWPEHVRELYNMVQKDWRRELNLWGYEQDFTDYDNLELVIGRESYNRWATPKGLDIEDVLEKYNIDKDQYDILTTDNLKMLAENMGIGYSAIRKRKSRLVMKLKQGLALTNNYIQ